ncbi:MULTISPECIES: ANTAR domain-containing response regulator [unclassified Rhodococcus (in: high G+C Gram-positive bacteria)]|uniref:ANTAR domain-containing response regulator n=1 Tax=unclassified Rhodococcus (in: high G+C Gram-positive bacteria) TaxID=192944 RepID=UPI00163A833C|nr:MULTISPECIES: GAF and ANTAR domain-containing protein [unclassified Rhodococcus (in: high G+C Gram-positive bacteria)]MBC2644337.1 GAF and ANTAR domain-containing protein [Rhodococcus sp. 3A]MBC2897970.1 GAF and ANTAR domain-containing protein [Rhodococcus sp. 4CII]
MSVNGTDQMPLSEATRALETVTDALTMLREETAAQESLEDVLGRLAQTAAAAVPDADAVSVTHLDETGPRTVALTDDYAADIDDEQYAAHRGPCLQAAASRLPVRAVVGEHADRWPEFTAAARQAGIRAYLSVPLIIDTPGEGPGELVGSFNVYARTAVAFDPFDEKLMQLLTTAASAAIGNARRWRRAQQRVEQLTEALTSRADIDQAKGMMMVMHGIGAEEAFARLTVISQRTNTKVHRVAKDLIDKFSKPSSGSDPVTPARAEMRRSRGLTGGVRR